MLKILVTGANGQLGKACKEELVGFKPLMLDRESCDLTDAQKCRELVEEFKPEVVIHCGAYTNVKKAQSEADDAYAVNALGTFNLLSAISIETLFVYISTDFVFDGEKTDGYLENDRPNPQTVYGRSKLAGELMVRDMAAQHLILRTAWVFGEGKNFVQTMLNLAQKQSILPVVNDQIGSPTFTKDLASWIHQLIEQEQKGIFHCVNDGRCSWSEFADEIMRARGLEVKVEGITTEQYVEKFGDNTPRPKFSVLDNRKLKSMVKDVRNWQDALKDYLMQSG